EGTSVSLNLRLPSGQMAVQTSAPNAAAAVKSAFEDLLQQVSKHKDLLRASHKWQRGKRGDTARPSAIVHEVPFEQTLAAVFPPTISSDDIRSYVNVNLARLERFVEREIYFREAQESIAPDSLSKEEVIDETIAASLALSAGGLGLSAPALASEGHPAQACSPGAHMLSHYGDHVYPDTGNGGYTSVHTNVDLVYEATANRFLAGNHVVLTDRAAQCLTSFSLDFERKSLANKAIGPDMRVNSVAVDGKPAAFSFVQPAYPGDPKGPNDPDPRAHEASQRSRVGGPGHNPLPPACSPELT